MSENRFIYLPLGGAGEIGMNAYVYGYGPANNERLIVVDLGVTFPDIDGSPGVDLILPDVSWLIERRDRIGDRRKLRQHFDKPALPYIGRHFPEVFHGDALSRKTPLRQNLRIIGIHRPGQAQGLVLAGRMH